MSAIMYKIIDTKNNQVVSEIQVSSIFIKKEEKITLTFLNSNNNKNYDLFLADLETFVSKFGAKELLGLFFYKKEDELVFDRNIDDKQIEKVLELLLMFVNKIQPFDFVLKNTFQ